jgi:hypothetical protein
MSVNFVEKHSQAACLNFAQVPHRRHVSTMRQQLSTLTKHLDWPFTVSMVLLVAIELASLSYVHEDSDALGIDGFVSWTHFAQCSACRNTLQAVLQSQLRQASDSPLPVSLFMFDSASQRISPAGFVSDVQVARWWRPAGRTEYVS